MKKVIFTSLLISLNALCYSQWNLVPDNIQGLSYTHSQNDVIMTSDGQGYRRIITPNSNTQQLHKTNSDWQSSTLIASLSYTSNILDFINDSVGVKVSTINGVDSIYKTIDGGANWSIWSASTDITHIQLINDSTLFYANSINGVNVFRLINQRQSVIYSSADSLSFLSGNGIHFIDSVNGSILSVNPQQTVAPNILKKTTNAGGSWYDVFPQSGTRVTCLKFLNSSIGYFGNNNGHVYKTIDAGITWRIINTPLSASINDIEFGPNNEVYLASMNGMLVKSIDLGSSWTTENVGTNKNLIDIHTFENSPIMYVNTSDGEIYKRSFTTNISSNIEKVLTFSIFPNPVADVLTISPIMQDIELVQILNVKGQIVFKGSSNQIEVSDLSAGLYFLLVKTNSKIQVLKFIKD